MRFGSRLLIAGVTAFFITTSAAVAQEELPLEFGTYAQNKDWCKLDRADPKGPDFTDKRAFINLTQNEINWNNSVGQITNIGIDGNKVTLAVQLTTDGQTKAVTLPLIRKTKKIFVLGGINFFRCTGYMPNPRLGR